MKPKLLLSLLLLFSFFLLKAQDVSKEHFQQAHQQIAAMLEGKQPLDLKKQSSLQRVPIGKIPYVMKTFNRCWICIAA